MNKRTAINWTSTTVPLWETDCIQFLRAGQPFELRNVTSEDHHIFVAQFARTHDLDLERIGNSVIFSQRPNKPEQPTP